MMLRSGGGDVDPVPRAALGHRTRRSRRRRGQSRRSPQKQFPKNNDRGPLRSNARPRFTAALGFASRARENAARERLRPLSLNKFSRARIGRLGQKLSACTSEPPAHDVAIGWRRRRPRTSRCARPPHPPIAPPPRPKPSITSKTISQKQRPRPAALQRSATIHRRARLRLARAGKRSERAAAASHLGGDAGQPFGRLKR